MGITFSVLAKRVTVTGSVLSRIGRTMAPFYRKIAADLNYARQWTRATRQTDLKEMERLFKRVTSSTMSAGSNSFGYMNGFLFAAPVYFYECGTMLAPGTVRSGAVFKTSIHRRISRAVLPLYSKLASCKTYAAAVAKAINRRSSSELKALLAPYIKSAYIRGIRYEYGGFTISFRYPDSRYFYHNFAAKGF
ncbi:hypothetical protein AB6A23_23640 [Paenibacillus tarimensis]